GLPVGPILIGAARPAHILTPSVTARGVVNMTAVAVVEAQATKGGPRRRASRPAWGCARAGPCDRGEARPQDREGRHAPERPLAIREARGGAGAPEVRPGRGRIEPGGRPARRLRDARRCALCRRPSHRRSAWRETPQRSRLYRDRAAP